MGLVYPYILHAKVDVRPAKHRWDTIGEIEVQGVDKK